MCESVPQMLVVVTRTIASVGPHVGSGTSSMWMSRTSLNTAARIVSVMAASLGRVPHSLPVDPARAGNIRDDLVSRDTKPAFPPAAHDLVGASLMRRADAAGQRLFRELVASRIAWGTASEVSRLIACDVVGFAVRTSGCAHEAPCALHHCQNALRFTAVLGNRGPRLPGLTVRPDAGCLGNRVLDDGRVATCDDYAGRAVDADLRAIVTGEEGVRALAAVPVGFGAEVRAVLYVGMRHAGAPSAGVIEALTRVCGYAGAGMAAARDRARVEEIAAQRERRRLARALHDDLGQRLFGLGIQANQALRGATSGRPDLLAQLEGLAREVAGTNGALRRTLHNLDTPPTPAGALAVTPCATRPPGSASARACPRTRWCWARRSRSTATCRTACCAPCRRACATPTATRGPARSW